MKILLVGPRKCGKSTLANVLGELQTTNEVTAPYFPTLGARIVEAQIGTQSVEFWEISGDLNFKQYWGVLAEKANGTIFVFSDSNDLNAFLHNVFPQKNALFVQTCTRGTTPSPPPAGFTPVRIYDDDILAFKAVVHQWVRNYYLRTSNFSCLWYTQ